MVAPTNELPNFKHNFHNFYYTNLLKNQVKFLLVLEELGQLNDVGVLLAVVERFHLAEDAGSRVSRHLVDDLHGVFLVGVHVDAGLDAGVGALAQYLPRQFVHVLETRRHQRGSRALLLAPPAFRFFFSSSQFSSTGIGVHLIAAVRCTTVSGAVSSIA